MGFSNVFAFCDWFALASSSGPGQFNYQPVFTATQIQGSYFGSTITPLLAIVTGSIPGLSDFLNRGLDAIIPRNIFNFNFKLQSNSSLPFITFHKTRNGGVFFQIHYHPTSFFKLDFSKINFFTLRSNFSLQLLLRLF